MGLSGDSALSPDILCLKHACSILRQTPNPVAEVLHKKPSVVGRRSLATNRSLVLMPNGRLSLVIVGLEDQQQTCKSAALCHKMNFHEPLTGLDDCRRVRQACFRKSMSVSHSRTLSPSLISPRIYRQKKSEFKPHFLLQMTQCTVDSASGDVFRLVLQNYQQMR